MLTCLECFYTFEYKYGVGMMYSDLENVLCLIHYTRKNKVKEILQNENVQKTTYYHSAYKCPKCSTLYNRFYFKIEYNNNQVYKSFFKCSKCKTILNEIDEDELRNSICPECGKRKMGESELNLTFNWD